MATATGRAPRDPQGEHHHGWSKALDDALNKMDGEFEKGTHTVEVKFHLVDVEVNSPGSIGYYQVTITTS
jgi:hypothetical protein